MSNETTNTEQSATPESAPFGPEDLVNTVVLIDEACTEGAFKGWEQIQKAFNIRNRLLQFAQAWQNTAQQLEEAAAPEVEQTTQEA
jgi:hypothetical protein